MLLPETKEFTSLEAASEILGVSVKTLRRLIYKKIISPKRNGNGKILLSTKEINFLREVLGRNNNHKNFSVNEAASYLKVSADTLRRWEEEGLVKSQRTAGGHRRYTLDHLEGIKKLGFKGSIIKRGIKIPPQVPIRIKAVPEIPQLYSHLHIDQKRVLTITLTFFVAFTLSVGLLKTLPNSIKQKVLSLTSKEKVLPAQKGPSVLQASDVTPLLGVNIESEFREEAIFLKNAFVTGDLSVKGKLVAGTTSFDLATETPTISVGSTTGTTTINNSLTIGGTLTSTGTLTANGNLSIGGDLTVSGDISNINGVSYSWPASQGSTSTFLKNNGSGALTWGSISTTADLTNVTGVLGVSAGGTGVSSAFTAGSILFSNGTTFAQDNTNFFWDDTNNRLRIGSGGAVVPSVDIGADLGTASLRWNNIYAANLTLDSGFTSSGQLLVTYNPTDTTFAESSLRINVTTPSTNEQMLGIGQAGEERAAIDAEGDLSIGFDGAAGSSVPLTSNPLTIYGHNTTEVAYISTAGDINFTGKLLEDGNEILSGMIAPFASACPTGWTEYTSARGRTVVGTVSGGTNAATVGTAFTSNQEDRTHFHTQPTHTHDQNGSGTVNDPTGGSISIVSSLSGATFQSDCGNCNGSSNFIPLTGVQAGGGDNTGTASTSDVIPYIQLTYCQKTAGADIAEWISGSPDLSKEMIVSIDPNNNEKVVASNTPYDSTVIGIISTQPGWLMGDPTQGSVQLALAGRVPTRVSLINGEIKRGDPITTSDIPGVGMKATRAGAVIGKAMEPLSGPSSTIGTIVVFVNPSWTDPKTSIVDANVFLYALADDINPGDIISLSSSPTDTVEVPVAKSSTAYDPKLFGIMNEKNIPQITGRVPVKIDPDSLPIMVGDFLTSSSKPGYAMKATKAGYTVGKALQAWTPKSEIDQNVLDFENSNLEFVSSFDIRASNFDKIEVFVSLGYYMGGMTADGYIDTNNNFIANDIKVNISSNDQLRLFGTSFSPSVLSEASDSAQLVSDSKTESDVSVSQAISKIIDKLETLENDISILKTTTESSSLSTDSLTSLTVLGDSLLSDTVINGKLNVGILSFDNQLGSIDAIGPLNLQSLALDSINFEGGKIVIDKEGNLNIKSGMISGNDSIRGNIEINPGQTKISIDQNWTKVPKSVVVTPSYITPFAITQLTTKGFTVEVDKAPAEQQDIYWIAFW